MKIKKGMYGLKQAALLAYNTVSNLLVNAEYEPILGSLGLWRHKKRNIMFCLCVDDFGVKYHNAEDLHHLKNTLQQTYTAKIDYNGENFLGFTVKWNYDVGYVDISMPGYVNRLLSKLNHPMPSSPQYSPHEFINIKWSSKGDRQYAQQEDDSAYLTQTETKWVQSAIGSLLYYARAIDCMMLPALTQIAATQANPTEKQGRL